MGLGIEARYERCRSHWQPHLENCKKFIESCAIPQSASVAVLGAGRLYDLPNTLLSNSNATFFDADPSAAAYVRSRFPTIKYELVELTGVLDQWTIALTQHVAHSKDPDDIARLLASLRVTALPSVVERFDIIISLNLLSQIPLFWRDRVQDILARKAGLHSNEQGAYAPEVQKALEHSMAELQRAHLAMLHSSNAKILIVISDRTFHYRAAGKKDLDEPAIFLDVAQSLPRFTVSDRTSWCWEIAPQGVEQAGFSQHHTVEASVFLRG